MSEKAPSPAPKEPAGFHYTSEFAELLEALGASLLVSTYQAGKVAAVRATGGRLSILLRSFKAAMGLAVEDNRLAIATRSQVWYLHNAPDIAAQLQPTGSHDACFVPRRCHVTGDVLVHEIAWATRSQEPRAKSQRKAQNQELRLQSHKANRLPILLWLLALDAPLSTLDRSYGSSTRVFPACAPFTTITASCRNGGRRS